MLSQSASARLGSRLARARSLGSLRRALFLLVYRRYSLDSPLELTLHACRELAMLSEGTMRASERAHSGAEVFIIVIITEPKRGVQTRWRRCLALLPLSSLLSSSLPPPRPRLSLSLSPFSAPPAPLSSHCHPSSPAEKNQSKTVSSKDKKWRRGLLRPTRRKWRPLPPLPRSSPPPRRPRRGSPASTRPSQQREPLL